MIEVLDKIDPDALFLGGDLLPSFIRDKNRVKDFLSNNLIKPIQNIREESDKEMRCFVIMGNDDPRVFEDILNGFDEKGHIDYVNQKCADFKGYNICGYSFIPPTPFHLKDWEKYDVSRFIDVGVVAPEEGTRTVKINKNEITYSTIEKDIVDIKRASDPKNTIYLFHAPPYDTDLDRADLDGKEVDHVPLDVHVGSIAIRNFIKKEQPFLTLHGHVHETVELTGNWRCSIGDTYSFTGVTSGDGLALVIFDTENLKDARRTVVDS